MRNCRYHIRQLEIASSHCGFSNRNRGRPIPALYRTSTEHNGCFSPSAASVLWLWTSKTLYEMSKEWIILNISRQHIASAKFPGRGYRRSVKADGDKQAENSHNNMANEIGIDSTVTTCISGEIQFIDTCGYRRLGIGYPCPRIDQPRLF